MNLADYAEELADLDDREKLEFLVDLPPLSAARAAEPFPSQCRVQECQTAVHLWVDVEGDTVRVEADVPRNSPTVRGLVALVIDVVSGLSPVEILRLPEDLLPGLGLQAALGMTRQQGLRGVMSRIQREIRAHCAD